MTNPTDSRGAEQGGRQKTALQKLPARWKEFWERSGPGPRVRRGASIGAGLPLFLLMGFLGWRLRTGLGAPLDILIGLLLGALGVGLLAIGLSFVVGILRVLPRYLGWIGAGSFIALTALFLSFNLPWAFALLFAASLVVIDGALGGAAVFAAGSDFRTAGRIRQAFTMAILLATVVANIVIVSWLAGPGRDFDLVENYREPPEVTSSLDAPDPAQRGPYAVGHLFYGSGTDRHRPEYGNDVNLKTQPVDARPFLKDFRGWEERFRRWYWGFGAEALPLNGRVWVPQGQGPFPLVLIVHGNHAMVEFSDPGYSYLGELLASRGFVTASIDENFLNRSQLGNIPKDNVARAWILLQHLKAWRRWNQTKENRFYRKLDLEKIALVGHSRGGEAVAVAAAFNRLSHYPDDATVRFDFGFSIKAIVALAPSDGQYRPAQKPVPLENLHYLTLQGSHDSDVFAFVGSRQFNRVRFTDGQDWFKASVYIYRANHGQFNTIWGRTDQRPPVSWLLSLRSLLRGEEQRRIAEIYVSAFLEATLHEDRRYRPLFQDHRLFKARLPQTIYVTRYQDSSFRLVSDYDESIDVTKTTAEGGAQEGEHLTVWRQQNVILRGNLPSEKNAAYLGWRRNPSGASPTYSISLPAGLAQDWGLNPDSVLAFDLAVAVEESSGATKAAGISDSLHEAREPLDFTVELESGEGGVARLPLSRFQKAPPVLRVRLTKSGALDKKLYQSPWEPVFQTYQLPLKTFVEANSAFRPAHLRAVRFRFDRRASGLMILDRVGFAVRQLRSPAAVTKSSHRRGF